MNGEIDLRACLRAIARRKKFIALGTAVGVVVAAGISFLLPKTYQASLIMEVGKIYPPPNVSPQGVKYIEDLNSTIGVITSEAALAQVREHLGLDLRLDNIRKRFSITPIIEGTSPRRPSLLEELIVGSPLIEIQYGGRTPEESVEAVNFLAGFIIKQHERRFLANRQALEEAVGSLEEKIAALENQAAAQARYLLSTRDYVEREWEEDGEFARKLRGLETFEATPLELLFLQSSLLVGKMHNTDLARFRAEIDQAILDARNEIALARIEIVDLKSRLGLSSPTEIRSPAVLPSRPSKPVKSRIVATGAILGLVLTTLIVWFREYLKE